MAIFLPFLGVNPSVFADSACPIISITLSRLAIAAACDRTASIFASARSESAMSDLARNR